MLVETKLLSRQNIFLATSIVLYFCRDKHVLVATKILVAASASGTPATFLWTFEKVVLKGHSFWYYTRQERNVFALESRIALY